GSFWFLGDDGSTAYLPEGGPAFSTAELPVTAAGERTQFMVTRAAAPGDFAAYSRNAEGGFPEADLSSRWGLPSASSQPNGTQRQPRWGFTAAGSYRLTMEASVELPSAERQIDTETVTVEVVRDGGASPEPAPTSGATTSPPPTPAPSGTVAPSATASPTGTTTVEPAPTTTTNPPPRTGVGGAAVLTEGHIDLAARLVDGRLRFRIHDGTVPGVKVWRDPEQVVLHVKPEGLRRLPAGLDFLGAPGETEWRLAGTHQEGMLWPGWSTETLKPGDITGGVTVTATAVSGPGHLALYDCDLFCRTYTAEFADRDGLPDSIEKPVNTHAHPSWGFTREGVYRLTLRMSATLPSGEVTSDTATLAIAVGNVDPYGVAPAGERAVLAGHSMGGMTIMA
ncbi:TIGR03773 family transporter-associated surface protein, partial [Kitasatospora sp. NPDC004799]|uniref:TIGR03773 family transporter-associated surface protein n=1 Tax=Kitasatospora sp. NPDC004799 TaxID=3154460 RepID=UPI0033B7E2E1